MEAFFGGEAKFGARLGGESDVKAIGLGAASVVLRFARLVQETAR